MKQTSKFQKNFLRLNFKQTEKMNRAEKMKQTEKMRRASSRFLINNRGQGVIESAIALFAFSGFIKLMIFVFWVATNVLWAEHHLYESLICFAENRKQQVCKAKLVSQINILNKTGEFKNIKMKVFGNKWKGAMDWKFYKLNIPIRSNFKLPY